VLAKLEKQGNAMKKLTGGMRAKPYSSQRARADMGSFFNKLGKVHAALQTLQSANTSSNASSAGGAAEGVSYNPLDTESWLAAQPSFDTEAWIEAQEPFDIEAWITAQGADAVEGSDAGASNATNATNASATTTSYDPTDTESWLAAQPSFDTEAWIEAQPPTTYNPPADLHDSTEEYIKCSPVFDIEAWIKDPSTITYHRACVHQVRLAACDEDSCCRVEILHEGVWGTICDDTDSDDDAHHVVAGVICAQAGCKGEAEFKYRFGGGSGPTWLDDVQCSGSEFDVGDCEHRPWGEENCGHSEDMGVCCADGCTGA